MQYYNYVYRNYTFGLQFFHVSFFLIGQFQDLELVPSQTEMTYSPTEYEGTNYRENKLLVILLLASTQYLLLDS